MNLLGNCRSLAVADNLTCIHLNFLELPSSSDNTFHFDVKTPTSGHSVDII